MTNSSFHSIQNFAWKESIAAIKDSVNFKSYDDFYRNLIENLPINSPETRRKYANGIQRRYFPKHSLEGLIPLVWRSYNDEKILLDLMRVATVETEPVITDFVVTKILTRTPGYKIDTQVIKDYIINAFGKFDRTSYNRLLVATQAIGFLGRYNGELIIENIPNPANAFLILLHDRQASTPRIVRLSEILASNWWHYLGLRRTDDIREILHQAEIAGLIARFTKVDELEQVTTRYDRDEYIKQAKQL